MKKTYQFIPYVKETFPPEEVLAKSEAWREFMETRRTVRDFSDAPVPREVIEALIMTASTAPSGAHKQPWTYCAVSDPELKKKIRIAAEEEEYESYHNRMSQEWLDDLEPLGTDWKKPFLEIAPWLIIVFKKAYNVIDGQKRKNYYVNESVGLSAGFLLNAIHRVGLVALTHTPSPMDFLTNILQRPDNERPFLLIPVGYPAEEVKVPDLKRKGADDIIVWY